MKNRFFHKDFQLNDTSFNSKEELLKYAETFSESIFDFLKDWLSEKPVITIKTSGSTGAPKNIELKKSHMINSAKSTGYFFQLPERTLALLCLPIEYIAGKMMLVRALVLGWHIDVVEVSSAPINNIQKTYDFSAMVPMQLQKSLEQIHIIKKLIVGGGPVSLELERKIQSVSTQIYATYGMTETITHIAVKKLNHFEKIALHTFEALPNVNLSVDNRNCLIINAPNISDEEVITNDVVDLVSSTSFHWKGRYDHVVNSGGIKLHPEEIERKLTPFITSRFFVTSKKDDFLGQKLILIIEGEPFDLPKIVYKDLTKYEIPKEVFFVSRFIETATQKIQRNKTLDKIL